MNNTRFRLKNKLCKTSCLFPYNNNNTILSHIVHLHDISQISDIPGIDFTYFDESSLCNLILYKNPSCTEIHNSIIIESTITYINATGRFV